jgi:hypothetical protein
VILLVAGLLTGILLKPESLVMNLAAIQAHRGLYPAQMGGVPDAARLEQARGWLLQVQAVDPGRRSAYELIGRIASWQGDPAGAMQAFAYRVALDGERVMPRYYPPGSLLRQLQGFAAAPDQDWLDLISVYSQWMVRFPERAYTYAEIGLVWQCALDDPGQATGVVQAGIDKGAVPGGLLEYYQQALAQADQSLCAQK